MKQTIRVIGIDPGLRHTGWGVVEAQGDRLIWRAHGQISPPAKACMVERLGEIFAGISEVVRVYTPDMAAVETVFVHRNIASAIKLGQARGAALAALAQHSIRLEEFSPRSVKQSLTGTGAAGKNQILYMIEMLFPKADPASEDAADALAVAVAAVHHWQSEAVLRSRL